ncbi:hypothetical protein [Haloarchaeobius litoreus]|uniref:Uncharacterized protein n=1 Tax=Haloarchaeobius litoreus TaxID=755306 RepID=A0ABD6DS36_9EURY|nr:hypothetical protein [Haloarchaeobius litoreus]
MIQVLGGSGVAGLVIALVVPVVLVAFGTYVGVLMALQEFFGADSWDEAVDETEE